MKILIAGVGNILRGDDGFGVAVAQTLVKDNDLPETIDVFEAGIAGIAFVQELMNGYDALIIADAVDKGAKPGTIFVFEPEIPEVNGMSASADFHKTLADAHYTEPAKVLILARALDILPSKIFVVGCQPQGYDEFGAAMSDAVEKSIVTAVEKIKSLVETLSHSTRLR